MDCPSRQRPGRVRIGLYRRFVPRVGQWPATTDTVERANDARSGTPYAKPRGYIEGSLDA